VFCIERRKSEQKMENLYFKLERAGHTKEEIPQYKKEYALYEIERNDGSKVHVLAKNVPEAFNAVKMRNPGFISTSSKVQGYELKIKPLKNIEGIIICTSETDELGKLIKKYEKEIKIQN